MQHYDAFPKNYYANIPLTEQQRGLPPCTVCDRPAAVRSLDEPDVFYCARCEMQRRKEARQ